MYNMGYSAISEWTTPKKHEELLRSIKQTNNGHHTDWSLTSAGTEHQVTRVVAAALTACTQASRWEMTLALWKLRGQTPMTPMSNFLESVKLWSAIQLTILQLTILMHIHNPQSLMNIWNSFVQISNTNNSILDVQFSMIFPFFFSAYMCPGFPSLQDLSNHPFSSAHLPKDVVLQQLWTFVDRLQTEFPIGTIVILNTVPLHPIHEIGFWIQDQRIDERCKEECSCIFSAYTFFLLRPTSLPIDVHFFSYR